MLVYAPRQLAYDVFAVFCCNMNQCRAIDAGLSSSGPIDTLPHFQYFVHLLFLKEAVTLNNDFSCFLTGRSQWMPFWWRGCVRPKLTPGKWLQHVRTS